LKNTEEYPKANKYYDEAIRQYERGNYTAAKTYAEAAKNSYTVVGDSGRRSSALTLLSNIEDKLTEQQTRDTANEHYSRAYGKFNSTNYHGCIENSETALTLY
jgi:HEPN domain-containing protein